MPRDAHSCNLQALKVRTRQLSVLRRLLLMDNDGICVDEAPVMADPAAVLCLAKPSKSTGFIGRKEMVVLTGHSDRGLVGRISLQVVV